MILFLLTVSLLNIQTAFGSESKDIEKQALTKFEAHIPKINSAGRGCVGGYEALIGDINDDKLDDAIVAFSLNPCDGGNMSLGTEAVVYINQGEVLKVVEAFPDTPCGIVKNIKNGFVIVHYFECGPPYIERTGTQKYAYKNGVFKAVK